MSAHDRLRRAVRPRHWIAWAAVLLAAAGGCSRRDAQAPAAAEGAPGEKRFPLSGEVLAVDARRNILQVHHDEVKDYMPSMTMEFAVSAGDALSARVGERIRAMLVVDKAGNARLEDLWPDDKVAHDTIEAGARGLREDTNDRGRAAYREVGEAIPDFALYDQDGRVVQSSRFRGRQIMLNFIYSRCPIANMCPAATAKMVETQGLARKAGVANVEFISITLDPANDTPGVLKAYASDRGIDTGNFSFLTGPQPAIRDLLAQFGVIAEVDGDILKHTLATLLIDEQGRITWRADGSAWEPKEFVSKMHRSP